MKNYIEVTIIGIEKNSDRKYFDGIMSMKYFIWFMLKTETVIILKRP